ncbi:MAG: TatD family hydrolase [Candidatus Saccharibacteria bacterium]|nr:TatD family hydrolase [Candidatus Saccharibacteria bacterium]
MLVDSHCHIHEADFPIGLDEVLNAAKAADVQKMITIGTDESSSRRAIDLAVQQDNIWATVGVHPHSASSGCEFLDSIDFTANPKIVAIGETGLDYHYDFSPHKIQQELLRQQLIIAIKVDLPVVFHVREAFDDFWMIFDEMADVAQKQGQKLRGVIHSFSDNLDNLQKALKRGLYIGVNGIATFTKDETQLGAFRAVPLEKLLIETDAPYLAPKGKRGQINQPAYVRDVAKWLAEFYKIDFNELVTQTTKNAHKLFGV